MYTPLSYGYQAFALGAAQQYLLRLCAYGHFNMTPEAKVKLQVRKLLDELHIYYFFPPANGYGRAGIPDVVGCVHSHFVAIECKAGRGVLTALQERELAQIDDAGGFTFVANENNINELKEKLVCLIQKRSPNA